MRSIHRDDRAPPRRTGSRFPQISLPGSRACRLVAIGFEERRPAPAYFAVHIGRDVMAVWPIVTHVREMRGEMRPRILETAKLKVIVDARELGDRIGDEILVAQLTEPVRRNCIAG